MNLESSTNWKENFPAKPLELSLIQEIDELLVYPAHKNAYAIASIFTLPLKGPYHYEIKFDIWKPCTYLSPWYIS